LNPGLAMVLVPERHDVDRTVVGEAVGFPPGAGRSWMIGRPTPDKHWAVPSEFDSVLIGRPDKSVITENIGDRNSY
jgi:hypothetical protein